MCDLKTTPAATLYDTLPTTNVTWQREPTPRMIGFQVTFSHVKFRHDALLELGRKVTRIAVTSVQKRRDRGAFHKQRPSNEGLVDI